VWASGMRLSGLRYRVLDLRSRVIVGGEGSGNWDPGFMVSSSRCRVQR
jgi:hypothetical protein